MPGGGYANLELYERLGATPDVNVVTILGEGSFHQVHGGTTTNRADPDERRSTITGYADHFAELRGRQFRGAGKTLHYVGTMFPKRVEHARPPHDRERVREGSGLHRSRRPAEHVRRRSPTS